jgi:hypothetical protein
VEGDALESNIRSAVERGIMKPEDHGKKAGFVVMRDHPEVHTILGEFGGLNGDAVERVATPAAADADTEDDDEDETTTPALTAPAATSATTTATATNGTPALPRKRTRRGSRGGRRRGGRGRNKTTAAGTGTEAAD